MKNLVSRSASVAGNGHKSTPPTPPPSRSLDTSPVYQEAQRVGFALIELLETGMEGHQSKIDDDIVAHVQLMKDEVDKQLSLLAESAKGQNAATQKQVSEITDHISAMHKLIVSQSEALVCLTEKVLVVEKTQVFGSQQQQSETESIQQTTNRLIQRMDQFASRLGEVQKKAVDHNEQVTKYFEILSTRMESMDNLRSASDGTLNRLEAQTAEHFSMVDVRMDNHVDVVTALSDRVGTLETVVQTLEVEAFQPEKLLRGTLAWLRHRTERFETFMGRQFKRPSVPDTERTPDDRLIEIRRKR